MPVGSRRTGPRCVRACSAEPGDDARAGDGCTGSAMPGLGRSTLYRLLAGGEVPIKQFLIGREVRLAKRQLIAWLDGR